MRWLIVFLCFIFWNNPDCRAFRLPSLFTNNMVLQRNNHVTIFGTASVGEKIMVFPEWTLESYASITDDQGQWFVRIPTTDAGSGFTLIVKSETTTITLENVALGEVWLCSGQSNMQWTPANGLLNYEEEKKNAGYPDIRFFTVPTIASNKEPVKEVNGKWVTCTPGTMDHFSSVGYFYARELYKHLNVPIGIINASWGGGNIEQFIRPDLIDNDTAFMHSAIENSGWRDWLVKNLDTEQHLVVKEKTDDVAWSGTIYNGMISPLTQYKIAGVIWYQGESQRPYPYVYARLMQTLVNSWRKEWGDDIPFYSVQIAPFRDEQNRYILRHALLIEQQIIAAEYTNCGIISTNDIGEIHNIHPKNKQEVGKRLALLALGDYYKWIKQGYQSPVYHSYEVRKDKIIVKFKDAEGNGGLIVNGDKGRISALQIAGADSVFYEAYGELSHNEKNTIIVWSPKVKSPVAVRYCFWDIGIGNLYNKAMNPVFPFRTDNWDIMESDPVKL